MIFEYFQVTGFGGSAFSLDFIARVMSLVLAGLVTTVVGFKLKGVWGAALALAAGVMLFLYNEGVVRF
jgi:hypothetical protein